MTCYTFSVRKIIPESKNMRTAMKNINEQVDSCMDLPDANENN